MRRIINRKGPVSVPLHNMPYLLHFNLGRSHLSRRCLLKERRLPRQCNPRSDKVKEVALAKLLFKL